MRMKRLVLMIAFVVVAATVAMFVLRGLAKARVYSGPGIYGNLRSIQLAKDQWLADGHTNEWPTAADLFPGSPRRITLSETLRPVHGEIYFINHTGAPPFAFILKPSGRYRGGEVLILTTNGLGEL